MTLCYACDNLAVYFYKSKEEYEGRFRFLPLLATCVYHNINTPPGGNSLYRRLSPEEYQVWEIMCQ